MRKYLSLILALVLLTCSSCAPAPTETQPTEFETAVASTEYTQATTETVETEPPDLMELLLDSMTTEELVGQLFLARCPAGGTAVSELQAYHLGGYILFGRDFDGQTPESVSSTISAYQNAAKIPLLIAVDEEGGYVNRVSSNRAFRDSSFRSPRRLYDEGGLDLVLETEKEKCQLLTSVGVNVNMAPVCDVTTDHSAFMYSRSLGQSPQVTGEYIAAVVDVMASQAVGSVLKHFPGYGNNTDTHIGIATDRRSLESLEEVDLVPFRAGIAAGCDAILISHTIVECLDAELPASLSPTVIGYLRQEMGFDGVVVTDDLVMQAITDGYGAGESAVMAVLAGNDLLCSSEYAVQYTAVLEAVENGRIPLSQVRDSARRVLLWKQELGILTLGAGFFAR